MKISSPADITSFIANALNEPQRKAVMHDRGSLLIIAGAGSGKTRVITTRIAYLITQCNVEPHNILALTFTNKAALEMRGRIAHFIGNERKMPFIGTFHAYCLRFLKTHADLLPHGFLTILDEDDQHKLLQSIITRSGLTKKTTPKQISYQISQIKNQSLSPDDHSPYESNPLLFEIFKAYEHEKRLSKSLDFDDLLLETLAVFQKNPALRSQYQQSLHHILVDEYQDTNIVQHELLKYLALTPQKKLAAHSLCAVGDEDQSIYSWRGATIANMLNFTDDFPHLNIIKIEQNYRSVQPILEVANQVISYNRNRNPKSLWSEKKGTDRIRIGICLSEYQEADLIAQYIKAHQNKKNSLQDIAILYRAHYQSRALEEALLKQGLPYKIVGGIQFYERKEIKDILAYLRLVINPYDRISFFRVINTPSRGIGAKGEESLLACWDHEPFASFDTIIAHAFERELFTGTKGEVLLQFAALLKAIDPNQPPSKAVALILEKTQYFMHLKNTYDAQEALDRIDNVKELLEAMLHHESEKKTTIASFLDEVALMQTNPKDKEKSVETVTLMTLHAAKGLEFKNVIITGLEEGLLPSSRSLSDEDAIEEERRLLYVGITRAEERLLITHARYRYLYGAMNDSRPSRFLKEIPESLAPSFDYSYWTSAQVYQTVSAWIGGTDKTPPASIKKSATLTPATTTKSPWKKNQPVMHHTFGVGIIQDIELKNNQKTYLTVTFKTGKKKLAAEFLKAV